MHTMKFNNVDSEQARAIVDGMVTDGIRVKSFTYEKNLSLEGKGAIIIVYEEIPKPKKRNWLRWIFRR